MKISSLKLLCIVSTLLYMFILSTSCSLFKESGLEINFEQRAVHSSVQSVLGDIKQCFHQEDFEAFKSKEQVLLFELFASGEIKVQFENRADKDSVLGQCIVGKINALHLKSVAGQVPQTIRFPINFSIK